MHTVFEIQIIFYCIINSMTRYPRSKGHAKDFLYGTYKLSFKLTVFNYRPIYLMLF